MALTLIGVANSLRFPATLFLLLLQLLLATHLFAADWRTPDSDASWFWQLDEEAAPELPFDVYDVSLYDVSEDYIQSLKQQGTYVVCYFSLGTLEDYVPDRDLYTDADLGNPVAGYPRERWLNPESDNVRRLMLRRLDDAAGAGCDAVEPDNINYQDADTGFDFSSSSQLAYLVWLSEQAHRRGLAIGLKNNLDQAELLQPYYDFAVNEQCFEYSECGVLDVFIRASKPVFNAEYSEALRESEPARRAICKQAIVMGLKTLILNPELDGSYFYSCDLMYVEP